MDNTWPGPKVRVAPDPVRFSMVWAALFNVITPPVNVTSQIGPHNDAPGFTIMPPAVRLTVPLISLRPLKVMVPAPLLVSLPFPVVTAPDPETLARFLSAPLNVVLAAPLIVKVPAPVPTFP